MAYKVQNPCKVCGKMYTPCFDCEQDVKTFRWRTVACSMKCGMEYFRMVEEARKPKVETKEVIVEEKITGEDNVEVVDIVEEFSEKKYSSTSDTISVVSSASLASYKYKDSFFWNKTYLSVVLAYTT